MKKIFIKFICLTLACIFMVSVGAGCNNKNETPPELENLGVVGETETYLIERGRSEYSIVLPASPTAREITAKNELALFFTEATGITLPVKYDNEVTFDQNSKFISIGATTFAKEKNMVPTYEQVKENGFFLKTVDKSIFLAGYTDFGTLCAVYEFLAFEFDYDYYTRGSYDLTKISSDVKTKNYQVVEVPDINTMQSHYGYIINDVPTANRYRMMHRSDIFLYVNGVGAVHNTIHILNPEEYSAAHPSYYYSAKGQDSTTLDKDWCFTAHGNQEEFENMTSDVCKEITEEFIGGATGTMMVLGQRDINSHCVCDACKAVDLAYGAASAKGIIFCNRVLEKVYAWFETEEGAPYKREFYLLLLAYEKFVEAPVTMREKQGYVPNNGLTIHDHFGVMSAPINFDFTVSREENPEAYEAFTKWGAISNVFTLYSYDTNFQEFLFPFNSFESKQGLFQAMKEVNCISIFDAGQGQDGANFIPSVWSMLKAYLASKLRWDVDIDVNYYTEKFFKGVYGAAAEHMMNNYLSFRSHWDYLEGQIASGELNIQINSFMASPLSAKLWPHSLLRGWMNNINLALESIESLKTENPEEYQRIYNNVSVERLSVVYMTVKLYKSYYSESDLYNLKMTFKKDVSYTGHTVLGPASRRVDSLLAEWGV